MNNLTNNNSINSQHNSKWPTRIFELSSNAWEQYVLQAAIKLEIFTLIESKFTAEELMKKINGQSIRSVKMFLNALVAMELLTKDNSHYATTSMSRKYLHKGSDNYLGNIILHHHELAKSWLHLDESILSGSANRPRLMNVTPSEEEKARENFLMGMFNLAMMNAPKVVDCFDFSNKKTLLDLGGGPGTYAINFCKKNPMLKATVFDLPSTQPYALKTIKKFDLEERINFVCGDFNSDDITGNYDIAWLSHILHSEGAENADKIIKKAVNALNYDGFLLIHEFVLDEGDCSPLYPALFSLNMLQGTEKGQSYNVSDLTNMLTKNGLKKIEIIELEKTPSKIIKAQKTN
ncbi:MAG: SAM-dependent methyltransferase [Oligoflexia bacterium]|nr:SAM-dependent methyltransferase [Oligoflexia bacterium]